MNTDSLNCSQNPDWTKTYRDMSKIGLKNGLSDGRDSNFQPSFDKGYEDGFRNGFGLGYLKYYSEQTKKADAVQSVENAKSGMCIVCSSEKDNDNVADVRKKQAVLVKESEEKIKVVLDNFLQTSS